jgi:hypothetical protein
MTGTGENAPVLWIVHLGGLGDWILTWPSIQALRDSLPGIRFIGVGRPDFMQLAARFGRIKGLGPILPGRRFSFGCPASGLGRHMDAGGFRACAPAAG